jgi:hypothetical protein
MAMPGSKPSKDEMLVLAMRLRAVEEAVEALSEQSPTNGRTLDLMIAQTGEAIKKYDDQFETVRGR